MSQTIQIRLATLADLPDIQSCARAAFLKYVERMNCKPAPMLADFAGQIGLAQVFVALNNNMFAGYIVIYTVQDHLHLENVAVMPTQSGNGIGKRLVKFAEQTTRTRGLHTVKLYTNETMTENLAMYPKLGYLETGRKQQDGFKRVFFSKLV